jgi:outer membrane lipoprotein-sorting protein
VSRTARALAAGAALVCTTLAAHASPTGQELLRRSQEAERAHDYRGVRIIRAFFPGQTVTAVTNVIHRRPATTRVEYVSPPSVAGTVVLQIGPERWRHSPRDQRWRRAAAPPDIETLDLLMRNYEVSVGEGSQVARRNCTLLLIDPMHTGNPSRRIWVDRLTGLVLRSSLLNWRQEEISVSAFKEIEIDPDLSRVSALLQPPAPAGAQKTEGGLDFKPIYPRYTPPGYVFISTEIVPMGKYRAAHLRYGDGLNTLSLFEAPTAAFAQERSLGNSELSFTRVMTWEKAGVTYALMGDIHPDELRKMAASVTPPAPAQGR